MLVQHYEVRNDSDDFESSRFVRLATIIIRVSFERRKRLCQRNHENSLTYPPFKPSHFSFSRKTPVRIIRALLWNSSQIITFFPSASRSSVSFLLRGVQNFSGTGSGGVPNLSGCIVLYTCRTPAAPPAVFHKITAFFSFSNSAVVCNCA